MDNPLSDIAIHRYLQQGDIVIDPFSEDQLKSSSYDLRLGQWFFEEQRPLAGVTLFNPYDPDHIQRCWSKEPKRAVLAGTTEWYTVNRPQNIRPDELVILFSPGSTYLCHTEEFVGFQRVGTTMMKARSTLGRDHIEVCKCAGWGDNGYINRWTMEITNNSEHYYIPLKVGECVSQLVFFYTGPTNKPYGYDKTSHYQQSTDIEAIKKDWSPYDMLPKPL